MADIRDILSNVTRGHYNIDHRANESTYPICCVSNFELLAAKYRSEFVSLDAVRFLHKMDNAERKVNLVDRLTCSGGGKETELDAERRAVFLFRVCLPPY